MGGSGVKKPPANAGDAGLTPGSGRSPEERNGNPFHGKSHGQRSPVGYSPQDHKRVRYDLATKQQ